MLNLPSLLMGIQFCCQFIFEPITWAIYATHVFVVDGTTYILCIICHGNCIFHFIKGIVDPKKSSYNFYNNYNLNISKFMVYECLLLQFLRTHSNIKVPAIKDTAYNLSGYLFRSVCIIN